VGDRPNKPSMRPRKAVYAKDGLARAKRKPDRAQTKKKAPTLTEGLN